MKNFLNYLLGILSAVIAGVLALYIEYHYFQNPQPQPQPPTPRTKQIETDTPSIVDSTKFPITVKPTYARHSDVRLPSNKLQLSPNSCFTFTDNGTLNFYQKGDGWVDSSLIMPIEDITRFRVDDFYKTIDIYFKEGSPTFFLRGDSYRVFIGLFRKSSFDMYVQYGLKNYNQDIEVEYYTFSPILHWGGGFFRNFSDFSIFHIYQKT